MKREYNCDCTTGAPKVAFRETASKRVSFSYTHKKQSGGSGQYGKVEGYLEPLDADKIGSPGIEFKNHMMGNNIPPVCSTGGSNPCGLAAPATANHVLPQPPLIMCCPSHR